jgi:hypothetical protein
VNSLVENTPDYIEGYRRMAGQMLRHVDALALEVISACTGAVR